MLVLSGYTPVDAALAFWSVQNFK